MVVAAHGFGRSDSCRINSLVEGNPGRQNRILHAVHEVRGRACYRPIVKSGKFPFDRDGLTTQSVLPVRKACRHHGVRDQRNPLPAEETESQADDGRLDMNPVRNELNCHTVIFRCGRNDAGLSMVDAGHGVIEVGDVGSAFFDGLPGRLIVCRRVGNGNDCILLRLFDEVHGARKLRGNVAETDGLAGSLIQTGKHLIIRVVEIGRILGPALFL